MAAASNQSANELAKKVSPTFLASTVLNECMNFNLTFRSLFGLHCEMKLNQSHIGAPADMYAPEVSIRRWIGTFQIYSRVLFAKQK